MDELIQEFLVESYENLDRLDRDFVALESNPAETEKVASIFRTIHTIKGTSGCLGLSKLESVAHVGENLLSRLRDGQLVMDTDIATGLLKLVDVIREILQNIERTTTEGDGDYSAVCKTLVTLNARPSIGQGAVAAVAHQHVVKAPIDAAAELAAIDLEFANAERARAAAAMPTAPTPVIEPHVEAPEPSAKSAEPAKEANGESVAGNAIRVDVVLLDKLMNLVGELVLARNQVLQYNADQQDTAFLRTAQRLNLITSELQEGVMKTRMQPIGNLWNKFPRIVRDVANGCGKKIRLEMIGRETELDKTIIEAIKDPLTHVIRNSVDHGVESPDKRIAAGKSEEGLLSMRAFHEGGQVNIEITDDGKGINAEIIKRKATEKGLITPEHAARMTDREAINLVFLPGFSTAEKVTNVSGRGVGMDVVKTNIEKIGGTVDIKSKVGEGTTLRMRIPLTLAIIPALIVTSGGERFAIPQVSLLELVRLEENEAGVEMINGTPLYRLRGDLLPLVYLNHELKLDIADSGRTACAGASDRQHGAPANIVVLRCGERQFGLVVDQINDTEEIVVKPLGKQLKGVSVFAGATIMGDGKVALILDVMGVAQEANILAHAADKAAHGSTTQTNLVKPDHESLLLCQLRNGERLAIPLSAVARLEEFSPESVEEAGGQQVVQYRGEIMPLIDVDLTLNGSLLQTRRNRSARRRQLASARKGEPDVDPVAERLYVVVYAFEGRNVGLRVDQILDVVEQRIESQLSGTRPGVLGTLVIKERVTELLDLENFVRGAAETQQDQPAVAAG